MYSACVSSTGVSTKGTLRTKSLPKYQNSETLLKMPAAVASASMGSVRSTRDMTRQQVSKGRFFLLLRVQRLEKC